MRFTVNWSVAMKFEDNNLDVEADGVYLIGYRDIITNERYVVYVGQGRIGDRLAAHHPDNQCIRRTISGLQRIGYYRFARCADEQDRLDIERALYLAFKRPPCNEVEPAGSRRYSQLEVEQTFRTAA